MAKINYYEYSKRDEKYAKDMYSLGNYDPCGRFCQQSVEKRMKHYLEIYGEVEDMYMFSSHNLGRLYDRICVLSKNKADRAVRGDLSRLTDYYFDTNYPNEQGNIELDEEMAQDAIGVMVSVNGWIDGLL